MAENTQGRHLLTEKDFVDVVDADGNDLPPVPKHWGQDELPAGAKKAKSGKEPKKDASSKSDAGTDVPKGNAGRDEWAAYATTKGAPEEETKPQDDGGLSRDELRDKYKPADS